MKILIFLFSDEFKSLDMVYHVVVDRRFTSNFTSVQDLSAIAQNYFDRPLIRSFLVAKQSLVVTPVWESTIGKEQII